MDSLITIDISKFGSRELAIAADLLEIFAQGGVTFIGENTTLNFNTQSGYVFLSDEDFNVGILDPEGCHVVQFYTCVECGYEGTQDEALDEGKNFLSYEGFCSKSCALANL